MKRMISGWVFLWACCVCCAAAAESTGELASAGKKCLTDGDLDGAAKAYQAAARGEPENMEYRQQFSLVRQAQELQRRMETDADPERWQYAAWALHSLYVEQGAYPAALRVSQTLHGRERSAASAVMVAETALKMNKPAAAGEVLTGLDASLATPATQALLGVALGRQGKVAEAKKLAAGLELPADAGATTFFAAARLYAAAGEPAKANAALASACEATPPSRLEGFKEQARGAPEFAKLAATAEFTAALQTESKIPESRCSGGGSCAGCPNRGKCNSGH